MNRLHRYVWIVLGVPLTLLAFIGGANLLFMTRLNELLTIDEAAAIWRGGNTLFNALTIADPRPKVISELNPDIIVLGSSRSFHMRDYAFTRSFFSLGGGLRHSGIVDPAMFEQQRQFLREMAHPKYLFLFLDYWWFMEGPSSAPSAAGSVATKEAIPGRTLIDPGASAHLFKALTLPTTLLKTSTLEPRRYLDVLAGREGGDHGGLKRIGYGAVISNTGFGSDGSYYYLWLRNTDFPGRNCNHLGDIAAKQLLPHGAYRPGQKISSTNVGAVQDMIRHLERDGTKVIPILPPIAPSIIAHYDLDPRYQYIHEWRATMKSAIPGVWDFHDPRTFGSGECEFIDDIHGGDVTYLRILELIGEQDPSIRPILQMDRISELIRDFQGRQFVTSHGLGALLPPLPPRVEAAEPVAATPEPERNTASPPPATDTQDRHSLLMSERHAANADFLARMPDYEQRVYQRVQNIKNREITMIRLTTALVVVIVSFAVLLLWQVRRLDQAAGSRSDDPRPSLKDIEADLANVRRLLKHTGAGLGKSSRPG